MGNHGSLVFKKNSAIGHNEEIGKALKDFSLLAGFSDHERSRVGALLEIRKFAPGDILVKEGDIGDGFYLIWEGRVVLHRQEGDQQVEVCHLKSGDYFGEFALLRNQARGATVTAVEDVKCFFLSRTTFQELFSADTFRAAVLKRVAVSGGQQQTARHDAPTEKNKEQETMIREAIKESVLFRGLSTDQMHAVISNMYQEKLKAGVAAMKQGERGETFMVVESGVFEVVQDEETVAQRGPGESFGELALMYNAPRAATVTAVKDAVVWVLDRFTFRRILSSSSERKLEQYTAFLEHVELLKPLNPKDRAIIAEALEEIKFPSNHVIFKQGDVGTSMYIVHSGEVVVSKDGVETARIKPGEYFGERALLMGDVRAATVIACDEGCVCLQLDQQAFNALLGPLEEVMQRKVDSYENVQTQRPRKPTCGVKFELLKVLGTLGRGAFGHVQLVQDTETSKAYALKAVNKMSIVETGQHQHILNERNVMMLLDHPFIIKLYQTFSDRDRLYFLLEPVLGGELFTVLRSLTMFDTATARFYAASVVLIFEYMHARDIVYRDLKPENILLDSQGFLKLTDFGFAKVLKTPRTQTLCGTPDYLAPEIVGGRGHGKGVDWWTLGILIYEMLASAPPFYDDDPMRTYAKILAANVTFPPHFSKSAVLLIRKLLNPRPTRRLGVVRGDDIKSQLWFEGFDWEKLFRRELRPPIIPTVYSDTDLSNFEGQNDEQDVVPQYVEDLAHPGWDTDF